MTGHDLTSDLLVGQGEIGPLAEAAILFLAAFGAATLLPFQSELVFVALQLRGADPLTLVVVASLGNVLGSLVNYAMGRGIAQWRGSRWFPVSEAQLQRAEGWYRRWGAASLLLSWAPFGDAFTVIAGMLRLRLAVFVLLVTVAKAGRYAVLALGTAAVIAA